MRDIDLNIIGKRIKELRVECGMAQGVLAEKLGVAQNTISQYECNTKRPSIEILIRLAIELKTSADYLLGLED